MNVCRCKNIYLKNNYICLVRPSYQIEEFIDTIEDREETRCSKFFVTRAINTPLINFLPVDDSLLDSYAVTLIKKKKPFVCKLIEDCDIPPGIIFPNSILKFL